MKLEADFLMKASKNYLALNNILRLIFVVALPCCTPKNYETDERHADVTLDASVLYHHESIALSFNGTNILKDSNTLHPEGWYHYHKYFKLNMKKGDSVRLTTTYAGKTVIDTVINITSSDGRSIILLSDPFPKSIGLDSLRRIKVPYSFGPLSIEQAERFVSIFPDTFRDDVH